MESQDVFSQPTEIGGEDPFAGTDFGDFEQPPAPANGQPEVPIDTSDLPVVDREGNPVDSQSAGAVAGVEAELPGEPGPATNVESAVTTQPGETLPEIAEPTLTIEPEGLPTLTPEQAAAEAERYRQEKGEPAPPTIPTTASAPAQDRPASATEASQDAPYPEEPQAPEPVSQPEVAEGDQGVPTPASSEQPPTEPTSAVPSPEPASSETDSGDPEDAPEPEELTSKSGKTTHRRYLIMRVEGTDKFSQLHWYEGEKGKLVPRGTPGAKRQRVVLARGTEDALKFGFAAVGAPQDGVTLVAVAQLHFQPKRIRPKAPEPMRQRLEIS